MNHPKQHAVIGLKELREHLGEYIEKIEKGGTFTVVRRSKPVFLITSIRGDEEQWEPLLDFTKMKKGGIRIEDILSRI